MKINKLSKRICQHIGDWVKHQDRATGKTTGLAFKTLAIAYENQGLWICVKDHHGTTDSDRFLLKEVQLIVEKLGLEYFKFREWDNAIMLDTIEEYTPKEITVDGVKYREVI